MADRVEVATLNLTVTGDTSDIEAKIRALADKIKEPLTEAVKKVNSTLNSVEFTKTERVIRNTEQTIKKSYSEINRQNKFLGNSFANLGKKILGALAIEKLIGGIVSLVKTASDAYEEANLFFVSFGYSLDKADDGITDLTSKANAFAKALENAWGIPARQLRESIGRVNLFAKSMGLTQQLAYTLSTQITQIVTEIASLRNLRVEDALNKILAGLAGNSRPLRDIGIAVNEANIAQIAYKYGLSEVGKELTVQQKILARYIAIWEAVTRTGDIGDFSRKVGSLEVQLKLLETRSKELKVVWGTALMPAAKQLIYFLNAMINVLMVLGRSFQVFMAQISGTTLEEMNIDFQAASDAAKSTTDGTSAIAEDLIEADEALKSMLAGFDKFNVLKDGSSSLSFDFSNFDLSQFQLDLPDRAIAEPVEKMTDAILEFLGYQKIIKETTDELGNSIKEVTYAWGGWKAVSPMLKAIVVALKALVAFKLASWVKTIVPLIQNWALQMKLASMQAKALQLSISSLSSLIKALSGVFLFALIYGVISLVQNWDKLNSAQKVVYSSLLAVVGVLYLYSSGIGVAIAQTIKFTVVALANLVKSLITNVIPALLKTNTALLGVLGAVGLLVAGVVYLSSQWENMGTIQKVIGILGALTAAAFAAALALGAFHSAWSIGLAAVAIVAGIAAVVAAVESARAGVKFAKGGIVYGETHAIVGEYQGARTNPEVIAPLSDLNNIITKSLTKAVTSGNLALFNQARQEQSDRPMVFNMKIDGRTLGRLVLPYINQGQVQTNMRIKR